MAQVYIRAPRVRVKQESVAQMFSLRPELNYSTFAMTVYCACISNAEPTALNKQSRKFVFRSALLAYAMSVCVCVVESMQYTLQLVVPTWHTYSTHQAPSAILHIHKSTIVCNSFRSFVPNYLGNGLYAAYHTQTVFCSKVVCM